MDENSIHQIMGNVVEKIPIIHFITNYVTANDCANICLACNGSPIMADDIDEVEDMVSLCSSLLLNMGTLNNRTITSMLKAGQKANSMQKPIVFDPVGAGASALRSEVVKLFMKELEFAVIKGNISEIKNLFGGFTDTKGVDAAKADLVSDKNLAESIRFSRELSVMTGAVIIITGPIDIISTAEKSYFCRNGHLTMAKVTGTGCMLGAAIASYIAANPERILEASALAVASMGVCGELAYKQVIEQGGGTGMMRSLIIDNMSLMDADVLMDNMKLEIYERDDS